jgi:hypothetical protein
MRHTLASKVIFNDKCFNFIAKLVRRRNREMPESRGYGQDNNSLRDGRKAIFKLSAVGQFTKKSTREQLGSSKPENTCWLVASSMTLII